ncbi:MAG: hypothetical protein GIW95_07210 [Candidatus Eremiobacteraeota bacterium]|nr:hypothetical protein [Candidatus Eremiobacteraeota bacterium]
MIAAALAILPTPLRAASPAPHSEMRDARYCEILIVHRSRASFSSEVFSTYGLNDCPEATWKQMDAGAIARAFHA